MGRGVLQNGKGGGAVKFYPYEREGAEKSLSHAKGGAQKVFWVAFTQ